MRGLLLCLFWIFLLANCATPGNPNGGLKDERPPQLDSSKTTVNYQTNFTKQGIELSFDEWVKLNDIFNQVIISPPLEKAPTIKIKGKTVRFNFDEEETLLDSATYTINFGESIQDLTEGNPAQDMRFVFSTGDYIDSLEVKGVVKDVLTKEAVKDILVMLYENTADSVVRTERPFYFAKTDEQGRFKIENVKKGTFKIFALKDANLNYLFDQEGEQIAFTDSLLTTTDSIKNIELEAFLQTPSIRLMEDELTHYGLVKLAFNREPYDIKLAYEDLENTPYLEYEGDTIRIWYTVDKDWNLYIQSDTVFYDTLRIPIKEKNEFLENRKLIHINGSFDGGTKKLNPNKDIGIELNTPIISFDTAFIKVYEDTLRTVVQPEIYVDSSDQRILKFKYDWKEKMRYEVELLPEAISDLYAIKNDTIIQSYKTLSFEDFGIINLTIDSLDANTYYIVQLLTNRDNLIDETIVYQQEKFEKRFEAMPPLAYKVKIILDRNNNGRWDSGNYDEKEQAEFIFTKNLESFRANWELDQLIEFKKPR